MPIDFYRKKKPVLCFPPARIRNVAERGAESYINVTTTIFIPNFANSQIDTITK